MRVYHQPVLLAEVLECFKDAGAKTLLDCTVGDGGHSLGILSSMKDAVVVALDVDPEAIEVARERVWAHHKGRCLIRRDDYRHLRWVLGQLGLPRVDGFLFDLGISSRQVDEWWRGFTYREEAPLDMRMNPLTPKTARDIVMEKSEEDLASIIRQYGEERFSFRIAREIVQRRQREPFETTKQLVSAIVEALPGKAKKGAMNSVKRTFQALRIAVNGELSNLGSALQNAFSLLSEGGILCVISYHSLEDRIVKNTFKQMETRGALRVTRKPIRPSSEEIAENPRAKSAKLRVVRRCDSK